MRKKHKKAYIYFRIASKAVGLILAVYAIGVFGLEFLRSAGINVEMRYLVLFSVGLVLWVVESFLGTFDDLGKLEEKLEEGGQALRRKNG